jgi:hypothetical protein
MMLDRAVMRHGVHRGVSLAAVVMRHRGVHGVLHSVHRAPIVADMNAGPVGDAAVMVYVVMGAMSSTADSAAATTSRKTVTHASKVRRARAAWREASSLSAGGCRGG